MLSQLERLRKWASYRGLKIETSTRDNEWYMQVLVREPVAFTAKSGWEATTEAAASKVIEQLEAIGEDLNVG